MSALTAKAATPARLAIAHLAIALTASGCATSAPLQAENRELRRLIVETRQDLEEVRRDQERLRALVEYLQYSDGAPAAASPSYPAANPRGADPRWVEGGGDQPGGAAAQAHDGLGGAVDSGRDTASAAPMAGFPGGRDPAADAPGAPVGSDASRETTGGIVAGVRGGGNWVEPGQSGLQQDVPHVPVSLRGSGFDDGVRAFVDDNYDDSIQYFRDFIHQSPTSPYSDDAQYWIGESYLRKGLYSNAIKEFNQVVLRYGSGDRSAASLLKLAHVFSKIGDDVDARLSLQKLVNRYPGSEEAKRASALLEQMGG
jgi:tol-pal system protein YbgF